MTTSTAVVPAYRRRRRYGRFEYTCRQCGWVYEAVPSLTRDERMWTLGQHLVDVHGRVFPGSKREAV